VLLKGFDAVPYFPLKRVAKAGLCFAEISEMMSREFHGVEEETSELQAIYLTVVSLVMCKLEIDQEMSVVKSAGEDIRSEPFSEEEHLPEQFQFDMDHEDFSYMNSYWWLGEGVVWQF